MRHGPDVPNALSYQERRKRRLCTTAACDKKAKRGRTKCAEHLAAKSEYESNRNRAKGMRTWKDYLNDLEGRRANALHRGRYTDENLAAIPQCACGLRHEPPCDMNDRRREIGTTGMGTWAV